MPTNKKIKRHLELMTVGTLTVHSKRKVISLRNIGKKWDNAEYVQQTKAKYENN